MPEGWRLHSRMHPDRVLPMRIALKQSQIDKLESHLMKISNPGSEHFGQHWSHEEILKTFAPSQDTIDAVMGWLRAAGIGQDRIRSSRSSGWLHFNVTVQEAETLLKTGYHLYEHEITGQGHIACNKYFVPR